MRLPQWPWVSRKVYDMLLDAFHDLHDSTVDQAAYDAVCGERDRLQAQNDKLLEHFGRMDRLEHGVGEMAREPRPELKPMPPELRKYIEGFDNPSIRKNLRDTNLRRHANGDTWAQIMDEVLSEEDRDAEIPSP